MMTYVTAHTIATRQGNGQHRPTERASRSVKICCAVPLLPMVRMLGVAVIVGCFAGCRHAPRDRRIEVADTPEGRQCYREAQERFSLCYESKVRRGVCAKIRDRDLMLCPGARDASGEIDPTVIQLPGYRP
jgi:hypothetical protein